MSDVSAPLDFGPQLDVAAWSWAGAGADAPAENQDNYLVIDAAGEARFLSGQQVTAWKVPGWPAGHVRLAVLDGMGGHGFGREAAEAVVAGLLETPACEDLEQLCLALDGLHLRLQAQLGDNVAPSQRPGTTITLLEIPAGKRALLYHVGDSRLYQLRQGQAPIPLTVDHVPATVYAMEESLDDMDWWQQVHGEHRSQIAQAFILGNAFGNTGQLEDPLFALTNANLPSFLAHLPDRREMTLDPDSVYLLVTDGFWACPSPQLWLGRWPGLMCNLDTAGQMCQALFHALADKPPPQLHPDNLTAVVIRPVRGHDVTALPDGPGAR